MWQSLFLSFLSFSPFLFPSPPSPLSRICLMHKQFPCRRRHRQFPIITHLQRADDELLSRLGQFYPELRLPRNCETPRGILTQKARRATGTSETGEGRKRNGEIFVDKHGTWISGQRTVHIPREVNQTTEMGDIMRHAGG